MIDVASKLWSVAPTEGRALQGTSAQAWVRHVLWGVAITLLFTPVVMVAATVLNLRDIHIVYLVPVVIAATRFGLLSALVVALTGSAIAVYFFYEPIYSFQVFQVQQVVGLAIFVVVAAITSQLAASARAHAAVAAHNTHQLELLYAFSRRLAAATKPDDIFDAVQEHVSALVGAKVSVLFTDAGNVAAEAELPQAVRAALSASAVDSGEAGARVVCDPADGMYWMVRSLPPSLKRSGVLLVELGHISPSALPAFQREVEVLLGDAVSTLERLDLASTVADAELRRQSEALREAVIGSASHSLRTPLASIMGSASILAASPRIAEDERHAALAGIIVTEAEHLNRDIQKMLDAATLSADAIRPVPAWIEPTDLINATVEARRRELASHNVELDYGDGLPLVHADGAQVREALGLVLDNAVRYAPAGSTIVVSARLQDSCVAVSVADQGPGLSAADLARVAQKFYRGEHVRDTTRGSGLGLWIATSFVEASNGKLEIASPGPGKGTRVTLQLPAASAAEMHTLGGLDE